MTKMTKNDVLRHLGGSAMEIDRGLRRFADAAKVLSSDHPRLINEHPSQWVGVYHGKVAASATTMESLLSKLRENGVPAKDAIVRFIEKNERTLIL